MKLRYQEGTQLLAKLIIIINSTKSKVDELQMLVQKITLY